MNITEEQYEEYQKLIEWAKHEKVYQSAVDIQYLEDDIDKPIKKTVAMFALLGCEPVYSCCGFDYVGQPFHKSHQYGRPYVMLKNSNLVTQVVYLMHQKKRFLWRAMPNGSMVNIEVVAEMNPHWRSHECIHFGEECNLAILQMESFLLGFRDYMQDKVVLIDTNNLAKEKVAFWKYPPKSPWTINKSDFV